MPSETAVQLALLQLARKANSGENSSAKAPEPVRRVRKTTETQETTSAETPAKLVETLDLPAFERWAQEIVEGVARGGLESLYLYFTEAGRRYSLDVAKQSAIYKVPPELQGEARRHIPAEPLFPTENCLRFAQEVQACCADAGLFEVDADGGLIKRGGAGLSSTEIKSGIRQLASDEGQDVLSRIGELSRIAQEANDQVAQLVAKR